MINDEDIFLYVFAAVGTFVLLGTLWFFGLVGVAQVETYEEENFVQEVPIKLLVKEGAKIIGISKGNPYLVGYFILKDVEYYENLINKSLNNVLSML